MKNIKYYRCGKLGHIACDCRSKNKVPRVQVNVIEIREAFPDEDSDESDDVDDRDQDEGRSAAVSISVIVNSNCISSFSILMKVTSSKCDARKIYLCQSAHLWCTGHYHNDSEQKHIPPGGQ